MSSIGRAFKRNASAEDNSVPLGAGGIMIEREERRRAEGHANPFIISNIVVYHCVKLYTIDLYFLYENNRITAMKLNCGAQLQRRVI